METKQQRREHKQQRRTLEGDGSALISEMWITTGTGLFGLGTFRSRHFCTYKTDYICLFEWLYRQAKWQGSWCYTNFFL